jgi:Tannase and feruloyl esterase
MRLQFVWVTLCTVFALSACAWAQHASSCERLATFNAPNVEITKAAAIAAGTTEAYPWGPGRTPPLPAYCRVEGVINRRTGVDGEQFGITFALAMPESWNGDFLMQGGAGSNGVVMQPLGLNAAGDKPGLIRGFAVVSTDTGHKSHHPGFDFAFVKDEQAYLDFAYLANAEVATLAKQIIARYYGKAASFSYFSGCSTGGREGMILSQRYPTVFNGIIVGDPAMRTGLSNLAIAKWIPVAFNQIAPKDSDGKPIITQAITDSDRKLIADALLQRCDAKDGVADGLISDPVGCDFDPAILSCMSGQSESCLAPEKVAAIKKVMGGPKTTSGAQVYPGLLYDTGITRAARSAEFSRLDQAFSDPRQQRWKLMSKRRPCQIFSL